MEMTYQPVRRSIQGVGLGLRACHYHDILTSAPDIPWFEILSDNYFCQGGPGRTYLEQVCERYPVAMHSVGLSLGSTDALNQTYLQQLKQLAKLVSPQLISDHCCWISKDKRYYHELLPLPYTEETVKHVARRISQVQDFLETKILIENVSSYLSYTSSDMTEWAFLNAVATEADCYILFDINNVYVSATNHQFSAEDYINAIHPERVKQFHLAGYENHQTYLLDSHSERVHDKVWDLYRLALKRFGQIPTLMEWDNNIPEFSVLLNEANKAQFLMDENTR